MKYNQLGKAGIKVSEISYGTWVTFGGAVDFGLAKSLIHSAFEQGVNFFDCAEVYGNGKAEIILGEVAQGFRREDLVLSTKIFFGDGHRGPNDSGLSRKHLLEGTHSSLKRMGLEYVDLIFCHRPDPSTPMEETVRAMDWIIRQGYAFYWGTSEWSAAQIEQAMDVAAKTNCIAPVMEQPQYNMLVRERFEIEYAPIFEKYGIGTTIWSPLASGVLSGKYNSGSTSAATTDREPWAKRYLNPETLKKLGALTSLSSEIGCTMSQLAIAWCLNNPNVSTVICGATSLAQLKENIAAAETTKLLKTDVIKKIDAILR